MASAEGVDGKVHPSSLPLTSGVTKKSSLFRKKTLKDYVSQELTRGYILELEEERYAARREKVYTFMSVPRELEKLMAYGFFQCSDAFLFVFTFLPLRCLLVILRLLRSILDNIVKFRFPLRNLRGYFKPAEKCDLIKLFIFLFCAYVFSYIDTSVLYHVIKSQSVIKLYIFFNMLEVGDRLFASFVQDTLDALFLTATEKSDKKSQMGVTAHLLLTLASVFGHALVILLQGTTLSVAINANNRALLTVMMSNNFVELKGAVFKKFDKINLFQVSCSDVRERFHLCILLLVVCVQTMREYSWEESRFWVLFPDCVMVLLAELGVDWLKHAFITRFNEIPSQVYREYTLSLAYDLAQTKQRRAFSDHSDMVGRRLGFVPLPLAIVLARVVRPSLRGPVVSTTILTILVYFALSSFRLLGSIILLGKACDLIDQHKKESTPQHVSSTQASSTSSQPLDQAKQIPISNGHPEDLLSILKFSSSSQPTTRTPSPSRINLKFNQKPYSDSRIVLGTHIKSEDYSPCTINVDSLPVDTKYSPRLSKRSFYQQQKVGKIKGEKKHYYRSFSASHTPRPSLVGITADGGGFLPSLGEAPRLPDATSTSLLMANSAVSILSVSLNEEMLRAAVNDGRGNVQPEPLLISESATSTSSLPGCGAGTKVAPNMESTNPTKGHSRKYSLGSNLESEFPSHNNDNNGGDTIVSSPVEMSTTGVSRKFDQEQLLQSAMTNGSGSILQPATSRENIKDLSRSSDDRGRDIPSADEISLGDLDRTLVPDDLTVVVDDKENVGASSATVENSDDAISIDSKDSKEGAKQRKKKGLSWFLSHT